MTKFKIFAFPLVVMLVVFLCGCDEGGESSEADKYVADLITIEDHTVTRTDPYAGSITTISFLVKNNDDNYGEYVSYVEVDFFDIPGFEVNSLECEGGKVQDRDNKIYKCIFDDSQTEGAIESDDMRAVSISLKAPSKDVVHTPMDLTVSYLITYHVDAFRESSVPIINSFRIEKPTTEFSQSVHADGPIFVEFKPPVGGTHEEEGKTVEEHWGVAGEPFELKLEFEDKGKASVGDVQNVVLKKGDITLNIPGMKKSDELTCDFEQGDTSTVLVSEKDVEVPDDIVCNLETVGTVESPQITATLSAEFSYDYVFIKKQKFTIRPILE